MANLTRNAGFKSWTRDQRTQEGSGGLNVIAGMAFIQAAPEAAAARAVVLQKN